ncbi:putative deacetylase LmbE-like domain-containing protein [Mycena vitilis]|nr:putative deacetylase LmbE-like domain-containing protein [Mycena vitilis]
MTIIQRFALLVALIFGTLLWPRTNVMFGRVPTGDRERILLVTAHPDDETFFFSPTLTALSAPTRSRGLRGDAEVFVAYLSTGNAKGLGEVRRNEFGQAMSIFGIREERRFILDHPYLQDNKTTAWDFTVIANEIRPIVVEHNITIILTFDSHGITGHPNHGSAFAGAAHLVFRTLSSAIRPRLFALYSRRATKNFGPLAALISQCYTYFEGPVFVASWVDYLTALRATSKHPSQLRWHSFLKGLFSRYLWVNEWVEVTK